jgi:glycerol-3-phosphate acyltransferase PlsY
MINTLLWTGIGFFLGAMPFSFWVGHLLRQTDVRKYGDGNPGATNAWKAGGWRVGIPALLLDYLKGAVPVGLAHFVFGISNWGLVLVALAPALGHAYSPFLGFRGGKALAVTFGIWTGLTLAEGPLVLGLFLAVILLIQTSDGWAVLLGLLAFGTYLLLQRGDTFILAIWLWNTLLLIWKYRTEIQAGPQPRVWLIHLLRQNRG